MGGWREGDGVCAAGWGGACPAVRAVAVSDLRALPPLNLDLPPLGLPRAPPLAGPAAGAATSGAGPGAGGSQGGGAGGGTGAAPGPGKGGGGGFIFVPSPRAADLPPLARGARPRAGRPLGVEVLGAGRRGVTPGQVEP